MTTFFNFGINRVSSSSGSPDELPGAQTTNIAKSAPGPNWGGQIAPERESEQVFFGRSRSLAHSGAIPRKNRAHSHVLAVPDLPETLFFAFDNIQISALPESPGELKYRGSGMPGSSKTAYCKKCPLADPGEPKCESERDVHSKRSQNARVSAIFTKNGKFWGAHPPP